MRVRGFVFFQLFIFRLGMSCWWFKLMKTKNRESFFYKNKQILSLNRRTGIFWKFITLRELVICPTLYGYRALLSEQKQSVLLRFIVRSSTFLLNRLFKTQLQSVTDFYWFGVSIDRFQLIVSVLGFSSFVWLSHSHLMISEQRKWQL